MAQSEDKESRLPAIKGINREFYEKAMALAYPSAIIIPAPTQQPNQQDYLIVSSADGDEVELVYFKTTLQFSVRINKMPAPDSLKIMLHSNYAEVPVNTVISIITGWLPFISIKEPLAVKDYNKDDDLLADPLIISLNATKDAKLKKLFKPDGNAVKISSNERLVFYDPQTALYYKDNKRLCAYRLIYRQQEVDIAVTSKGNLSAHDARSIIQNFIKTL